ncbi:hypothetical protein [Kitasatospora paranensis]|uniref:hypothetical protein n=1 Tax=Kitasatospora paranensis TaxID=258053 RepID=UPI0031EDD324
MYRHTTGAQHRASPLHRAGRGRAPLPLIPTAQALRSAGHDVLLAGRQPVEILRATGLPVVEVGDGSTLRDAFRHAADAAATEPGYVSGSRTEEETMRLASLGFANHGRRALDNLRALAGGRRPDLLVHAAFDAAAPWSRPSSASPPWCTTSG